MVVSGLPTIHRAVISQDAGPDGTKQYHVQVQGQDLLAVMVTSGVKGEETTSNDVIHTCQVGWRGTMSGWFRYVALMGKIVRQLAVLPWYKRDVLNVYGLTLDLSYNPCPSVLDHQTFPLIS